MSGVCVFDFDGTLFDVAPFLPPVKERDDPQAWHQFFTAAEHAEPIIWVHQAMRQAVRAGHKAVVVTTRDESTRPVTERMLDRYDLPVSEVVMHCGPRRPDHEIKSQLLDRVIVRHGEIAWMFDDRPSVIRMLRARGLHVVVVPTWPTDLPD